MDYQAYAKNMALSLKAAEAAQAAAVAMYPNSAWCARRCARSLYRKSR